MHDMGESHKNVLQSYFTSINCTVLYLYNICNWKKIKSMFLDNYVFFFGKNVYIVKSVCSKSLNVIAKIVFKSQIKLSSIYTSWQFVI